MTFTWRIRAACIVAIVAAIVAPLVWTLAWPSLPAMPQAAPLRDPHAILADLKAGNARFMASRRIRSTETAHDDPERRLFAHEQHPLVSLLTCADSRIVPEFVFDQDIGTIFDVRNAGNVVDGVVLGSLEYAVEHLHTPVLVVMGHQGCGAIKAVNEAGDTPLPHHLKDLQAYMAGLKRSLNPSDQQADFLAKLSEENAKQQAATLVAQSDLLRLAVKEKQLLIVAAIYDLETGEVKFVVRDVR